MELLRHYLKIILAIVIALIAIVWLVAKIELNQVIEQLVQLPKYSLFIGFICYLFFVATKDIVVSVILSTIFIIFICGIFHEESKLCVAKNSLKTFCKKRKDLVNKEDYEKAKKIVKEYETQQN